MKPRVTVLSCVFPPEPVTSGNTSWDVAARLAKNGCPVTVVTSFPSRPGGQLYPGYQRRLYSRSANPNGIEIVRCFSLPSSESSSASRLIENLVFGFSSAGYLLYAHRPDVIYANTWPVFASGLVTLVATLRRIPYVVFIQDVYPESFAAQGRTSTKSLTFRIMRWIDAQVSRCAAHVVVISPSFARIYSEDRRVSPSRISVISNWADEDTTPASPSVVSSLRQQLSIPQEAFLAAYGGNIGVASGVETFVEAFRYLGEEVYGLVAGEGSRLAVCQTMAGGLPQLAFLTPWPAGQTMMLYQAADVLVLPTRGSQSMASVPSKLIRYMISGRPVIAAGLPGTELARIIETSGCGWLVEPDRPNVLAEKIRQVKAMPSSELRCRGKAGRRYALENFTSEACLPKLIEIIEGIAL